MCLLLAHSMILSIVNTSCRGVTNYADLHLLEDASWHCGRRLVHATRQPALEAANIRWSLATAAHLPLRALVPGGMGAIGTLVTLWLTQSVGLRGRRGLQSGHMRVCVMSACC